MVRPGAISAVLVAVLVLLSWSGHACAQSVDDHAATPPELPAALRGDYFHLESLATGGGYDIYVRYPEGYDPSAEAAYPTVYLTDGDSLFPILAATHLFLHYDERLPEALMIGIAYGGFDPSINRRGVDFPATGAVAFQRFLREELIPEVERRYRSDPARRILVGQSLGAGFAIWSAFNEPDLFWGRIASNPAFRPAGEWPLMAPADATRSDLGLFVASGSRDWPALRASFIDWSESWRTRDAPWALGLTTIEGGTHAANIADAYRAGMLWLFDRDRDAP